VPSDTLVFEVRNLTLANFSVSALNASSYQWTQVSGFGLPIGQNYSGYIFAPKNGTLYYITAALPKMMNSSLLVYKNTELVFNSSSNSSPIALTFTINSIRPPVPTGWSFLFGNLNIKTKVPLPSAAEIEGVVAAFGVGMLVFAHKRGSSIIMYLGMTILMVVGFVSIGILTLLIFGAYMLSYAGVNYFSTKKREGT
jgi:hypothetical protein